MTQEQELPIDDLAGRAVAEWFEEGQSSLMLAADKRQVADGLWLQSLLEMAYQPQDAARDERIRHAMTTIRNPASAVVDADLPMPTPGKNSRKPGHVRQGLIWLIAAILVVSAGIWLQPRDPNRQAFAAIDRIRASTAVPQDREYLVSLFSPTDDVNPVTARLFVRGGEAFAVRAPAVLRPGEIWFGRDHGSAWFQPAVGPALLGSGALSMQRRFLQGRDQEAPFLQLTTVLDRIEQHYELQLLADEIPPRGSLTAVSGCQHLRALVRRTEDSPAWLPSDIEIHASRKSGMIVRMVLTFVPVEPASLSRIQFDFVTQSQLPDNWYRPEGRRR